MIDSLGVEFVQGHYQVVQTLLDEGADPNVRTKDGTTPLIKAAEANMRGMTKLLIAKGAALKGVSTVTGVKAASAAACFMCTAATQHLQQTGVHTSLLACMFHLPAYFARSRCVTNQTNYSLLLLAALLERCDACFVPLCR